MSSHPLPDEVRAALREECKAAEFLTQTLACSLLSESINCMRMALPFIVFAGAKVRRVVLEMDDGSTVEALELKQEPPN